MKAVEHDGVWWSPDDPAKERVGTLRFDPVDGATLKLIVPAEKFDLFPELAGYERLFGITTTGKAVTLIRCHDRSTRGTLGRAPRPIEIHANELIIGSHCAIDPPVSKVSVRFRHLNEWYGRSAVRMNTAVKLPDFAAEYQAAPPIILHDDSKVRVSLRSGLLGGVRAHRAKIREHMHIDIETASPTPLSELRKIAQACGDLLSIACLDLCDVREMVIQFPAGEDAPAHSGAFYAVPIYKNRRSRKRRGAFILFRYSQVEDRVPAIFSAWLSQTEKLYVARVLYFAGIYGGGFVETKLLALTQAAEAFHRRFYLPGLYMPPDAFDEQVRRPMKASIPVFLEPSFRQSLRDRLKHANELSLRKRMRELVSDHCLALKTLVGCPSDWVNPIVDHRNEFTHFPVPPDTKPPFKTDPDRLLRYNFFLKLLLEASFLHVMGFSNDEIAAQARKCEVYRQLAAQFFRSEANGGEAAPV